MAHFYKHSGAVSVSGLLGGVALGLGAAAGLSAVYAYALNWIPFIYVNVLCTAGFGAAIGGAVYFAARIGKVRNNGVVAAVGLLCALVGVYYAWAFDRMARTGEPFTMDPLLLWDYVLIFNEEGNWSIGRNAKQNVTGIFLWVVWAVEAGVIIALSAWLPYSLMSKSVFCEPCDQWCTPQEDVRRLAAEQSEAVTSLALTGNLAGLRSLPAAPSGAPAYVRLDLTTCENCTESNYLSIVNVIITTNKKGEESTETKDLVDRLLIAAADVGHVREAGAPAAVEPHDKIEQAEGGAAG